MIGLRHRNTPIVKVVLEVKQIKKREYEVEHKTLTMILCIVDIT